MSAESRAKMRAAKLGKKQSPEVIERRRQAMVGRVYDRLDAAGRQRASDRMRAQNPMSVATTRAKVSRTRSGQKMRPMSPEHRAKISAANKGQRPTDYCIQRLRETKTGVRQSPELVAKRVAAFHEAIRRRRGET